MRRIATALFFLLFPAIALAQAPICDDTCEPNPAGGGYSNAVQARTKPYNGRGYKSPVARPAANSQVAPAVSALPGSQSYNYAIPILSLAGRNGLDVNLVLYYNSRVWTIDKTNLTATFNADRDFPSYGFRLGYGYLEYSSTSNNYTLTESDGSKRQLAFVTTYTYDSNDASFIRYRSDVRILRYKNGTNVYYQQIGTSNLYRPYRVQDSNGNYITITYTTWATGTEISTITDTLNRTITFNYNADHTLHDITVGSKIYTFTWSDPSALYPFLHWFSGLTVQNTVASGTLLKVLKAVSYPNGTSYTFEYGDWGIVNKINQKSSSGTIRSYVSYNYPLATTALSDHPAFTQQTVNNGSTSNNWTYATVKSGGVVTSFAITDPLGTKSTTNLSTNGLVSSVTITPSGQAVLRTTAFTWNGAPGSNPTLANATSTLNDSGQQSKVAYLYDAYANVTDVKEYDYGLVLTRRTAITYQITGGYLTNRVLDRPTQVKVYSEVGGEALKARTDIAYDQGTLATVSGLPSHDDGNFGSGFTFRGNATTITRYADAAGGSGGVSRAFTYDTLGNLLTAELDCCNTRTFTYDSATGFAFPVGVTSGSGPQLSTSATYYAGTFLLETFTDEAGLTTTYGYDSMDRVTSVTRNADGAVFETSFDDSSLQPSVTRKTPITGSSKSVQVTTADGLGRAIKQQLKDNGGTLISQVDTAYDAIGRPSTVSNPYKSPETPVYTTYLYDSLSRVTRVTPPGGSGFQTYAYSGNQVTVTDPAGKQRRSYTDGLGRLARVDEPGGTSGTGTVTITGSEQSVVTDPCLDEGMGSSCPRTTWDSGSVSVTVGGFGKSAVYGRFSTASSLASTLAAAFNADANSPVDASASSAVITFTAKLSGVATNYTMSVSSQTNDPANFGDASFSGTPSGATMTGGTDSAVTPSLAKPFATFYSYDPLDNLTQVSQGQQTRSYVYNGLSQLLSATTPESGTVAYSYTNAGTVNTRTDARNIVTTYGYDGLNRLASVGYSDTTPAVGFTYTGARLTSVTAGSVSESYTYDALGRISNLAKVINATTYNLGYGYNLASELTSLTYPSGRVVNQSYDAVGRLAQIADPAAGDYLSGMTYNSASQPTGFSYGNGVAASFGYNTRLQLASLRHSKPGNWDMLNLGYDYGAANNGQIQTLHVYNSPGVENSFSPQSYAYDAWGRLKSASTAGLEQNGAWSLQWVYDRYGNRTQQNVLAGSGFSTQTPTDPVTNRLLSPNVYDASGNLTNDTLHAYTYDAENRMTQVDGGATATYTYDGGPLRVKKVAGGATTVYVFSGSKVIAEYVNGALSKEYVYAGSTLLTTVAADGTRTYHHSDHLSIRSDSNAAGNQIRAYGHYPFGETWYEEGGATPWKFTSYLRYSESGLDYAIFRDYSTRLGRFTQPDPLAGSVGDPQSLNRYSYARNDPIGSTDSLGLRPDSGDQDILLPEMNHPGCLLDGFATSCSLIASLVQGGAAAGCLNNVCNGWGIDPTTGELKYAQYFCFAGGTCGYFDPNQAQQGYEWDGTLITAAGWWKLIQPGVDKQRMILATKLVELLGNKWTVAELYKALATDSGLAGLKGGNYNFNITDPDIYKATQEALSQCPNNRCDGLHIHGDLSGGIHLDTANPWGVFPFGALHHLFVDVILGNTIYGSWPIPR